MTLICQLKPQADNRYMGLVKIEEGALRESTAMLNMQGREVHISLLFVKLHVHILYQLHGNKHRSEYICMCFFPESHG